jgi:hypothetical protein
MLAPVLIRPKLLAMAVAAVSSLGVVACGDDDNEDGTATKSASPGGELFAQTGAGGALAPVKGQDDVYELTLTGVAPNVTEFTDRPVRQASAESLADFVESWEQRGFAQDPPNAALVLDQEAEDADTSVFELADPNYDEAAGELSYRATHVEGGTAALPEPDQDLVPPPKFGHAHLFIDPGTTPTVDFFVHIDGAPQGEHTVLTLDSPFEVFVGPGTQEAVWAGGIGGGFIGGQVINLSYAEGEVDVQVAGGSPPITGTAKIPAGADVTVQVNDGATRKISSGSFSLSP